MTAKIGGDGASFAEPFYDEAWQDRSPPAALEPPFVTAALRRIFHSPEFHASARQQRLLLFLVEETLAGRSDRLKAYNIATAVLGRDETFDPQADPVVRIEVSKLRSSLDRYYLTDGRNDRLRITIPKGGYAVRLEGAAALDQGEPVAAPGDPKPTGPTYRHRRRLPGVFYLLGGLALVLIGIGVAIAHRPWSTTPTVSSLTISGPTVRVKRFLSSSKDPKLDALAFGLWTNVASDLARFKTLQVFSVDSTAGAASVQYAVEGTVSETSDGTAVAVQLRDLRMDSIIFSRLYTIAGDAPDNVRLEVAAEIADRFGDSFGELFAAERRYTAVATTPEMAIRHCVLAFYEYVENERRDVHRQLRDCHERAIKQAPTYSQLWVNLAFLYVDEYRLGYNPVPSAPSALQRAGDAARRALDLDPTDARAHLALSMVHWFRHEPIATAAEDDRALQLNPDDPMVLAQLGVRRFLRGDWHVGAAMVTRALARGTGRPRKYHYILAAYHYLHQNYTAALDETLVGAGGQYIVAELLLPAIYGKLHRPAQAQAMWAVLAERLPGFTDAPRFTMLNREWPPQLVDALMAGLDDAGLLGQ